MHNRLAAIYDTLARRNGHSDPKQRLEALCHSSVELLSVNGAGVMLMAARVHQGTLYATDDVTVDLRAEA